MKNNYFELIDLSKWEDLLNNIINLQDSSSIYIRKFFNFFYHKSAIHDNKMIKYLISKPMDFNRSKEFFTIQIIELRDEWFLVNYKNIFYKCDQLDGLIECLKYIYK